MSSAVAPKLAQISEALRLAKIFALRIPGGWA